MIVTLPYHLLVGVLISTRVTRSRCLQTGQHGGLPLGWVAYNSTTLLQYAWCLSGYACACVIASGNHEAAAVWDLNTTSMPAKKIYTVIIKTDTKTFVKLSHKTSLYWLCLTSYPILTYEVSNIQVIWQKSWEMASRKNVRFLGLAQIDKFSDAGSLKNIWYFC